MDLAQLGWNDTFQRYLAEWQERVSPLAIPGRVASVHGRAFLVYASDGELRATVSGRLRHAARDPSDYPTVGDWVVVDTDPRAGTAVIRHVLPRRGAFVRKAPVSGGRGLATIGGREQIAGGATVGQALAANVDTAFCITAFDDDWSLNRIERYLLLAHAGGAASVLVLNKADEGREIGSQVAAARAVGGGVPIYAISALTGAGVDLLWRHIGPGQTVAMLGSSGVGKSTLINRLLGAPRLPVGTVRAADGKGRHTTARRELIVLRAGGVLIDTPGLRELQLWGEAIDLEAQFPDIEALARQCRFADCRHTTEPGCVVAAALASGRLDARRYAHLLRLRAEVAYLDARVRRRPERRSLVGAGTEASERGATEEGTGAGMIFSTPSPRRPRHHGKAGRP